MKKLFLFAVMAVVSLSHTIYGQDYYWYNDQKIALERGDQQYIIFDDLLIESDKVQLTASGDVFYEDILDLKWGISKSNAVLEDIEHIYYQIPSFKNSDKNDVYITHRFYVKLKSEDDITSLQEMIAHYDVEIEQKSDLPLWYILRCGLHSQYNALELANLFYESGLFATAEPEFLGKFSLDNKEDVQIIDNQKPIDNKYLQNGILHIKYGDMTYNVQGVKIMTNTNK